MYGLYTRFYKKFEKTPVLGMNLPLYLKDGVVFFYLLEVYLLFTFLGKKNRFFEDLESKSPLNIILYIIINK